MVTILHGDNLVESRKKLVELISVAKKKGKDVVNLEAAQLTPAILETKLLAQDLFGTQHLVVIEDLHSLPRSKQKTTLIEQILASPLEVILWEKRELTPAMLKKFDQAKTEAFQLSKDLFIWLETLSGQAHTKTAQIQAFHRALQREDAYLCLIMLARQLRLLIQIKETGQVAGAPWMIKKLSKQAQTFSLNQLIAAHTKLLEIDQREKTSSSYLDLAQELDLFHLGL